MARKIRKAQRQVLVVNPTPLDDDKADSLISAERERTDRAASFEDFLRRHPRDLEKLAKRRRKTPASVWKLRLLSLAEKEYDALIGAVQTQALSALGELIADPLGKRAAALRGHRQYRRVGFYRNRYRIVYSISKSRRELVVTRIRRSDAKTYVGHEQNPL